METTHDTWRGRETPPAPKNQTEQMRSLLYYRWTKIFAWMAMGMLEENDQNRAAFRTAYGTYRQFCVRHGFPVATYGIVQF